jgi:hypothetical protein
MIGSALLANKGSKNKLPDIQPVNFNQLNNDAYEADILAMQRSIDAEKRFSPETYELRQQGQQALLDELMNPSTNLSPELRDAIYQQAFQPAQQLQAVELPQNQLLERSRANILDQLNLGGELPLSVRQEIARASAGRAGQVGLSGQAGNDLVARDLGLSALGLQQQRQQAALAAGSQQQQEAMQQQSYIDSVNRANVTLQQQQQNKVFDVANFLDAQAEQAANRRMQISQLGMSTARPTAGLSGADASNIAIANMNAQTAQASNIAQMNAANSAARGSMFGSLLGAGAQLGAAYMGAPKTGGGGTGGAVA